MKDKKIAVVGIGGVGGYLAGMLVPAFPHVTLAARGARGETIAKDGLTLHSEYQGERRVRPERVEFEATRLSPQDYIFLCVKNYSLEQAVEEIKGAVTDKTVVIPVMNGVDAGERTRRLLPTCGLVSWTRTRGSGGPWRKPRKFFRWRAWITKWQRTSSRKFGANIF